MKARMCAIGLTAAVLFAPQTKAQQLDLSHGGALDITARDGIDWRQSEQMVVAHGDARARRGSVTVTADTLSAWYRKKAGSSGSTGAAPATGAGTVAGVPEAGGSEIYKMQASGTVRISTQTDLVQADRAVYQMDESVLVLTGRGLKLTTPTQTLTARDSLEYWAQKHMAVARGDAVALTNDGRRIAADTLVAYTSDSTTPQSTAPNAPPKPAKTEAAAAADPLGASGKLQKMEAFGHVSIRTPTDTVTGDRAVYVPDTGMARLTGQVRITRGENQLNGSQADVNMKTGVAQLVAVAGERVQGLVIPNDSSNQSLQPLAPKPGDKAPVVKPGLGVPR